MIKDTISAYDIERIALFVIEDIQESDSDIHEIIGMYLENIPGLESLNQDEIEQRKSRWLIVHLHASRHFAVTKD